MCTLTPIAISRSQRNRVEAANVLAFAIWCVIRARDKVELTFRCCDYYYFSFFLKDCLPEILLHKVSKASKVGGH